MGGGIFAPPPPPPSWIGSMLPHPLFNFEIQKYYQNEPKFKILYSRNDLYKIKDGAYILNFDEYESIEAHWIVFYMNAENVTYFVLINNVMKEFYDIKEEIKNSNDK